MRYWSVIVSLLFGLIIVLLTVPVLYLSFFEITISDLENVEGILEIFLLWPYWAGIGLLVVSQWIFLILPVNVAFKRPTSRRTVLLPIIVSGVMAALLAVGFLFAILEAVQGAAFLEGVNSLIYGVVVLIFTWIVWSIIFYRISKRIEPKSFIEKLWHQLFKGSVIELLVAIPTHIFVRSKSYCCAGFGTFFGITCGLAIMLFSFGPGVYFLFVQRWKKLHPNKEECK